MKKIFVIGFFTIFALLYGGTTGKITGVVIDAESGMPLPGCNIIVLDTDFGTATDINGEFFILNIPPGRYDIKAMMIGYATQTVTDIQVNIDLTTRVDFDLSVEAVQGEEVTVTADRKAIQMDLTSSEARVSSEQLDALPVNEIWDVINIQSGVTKDAGGGIHIRGGRSREVAYWVDGVSVTDSYDGGLSVAVDNDAIQELQVISGTFNAEYGQAMSGIINLVTKDGSSNYEGYVSTYASKYETDFSDYKGKDDYSFYDDQNIEASLSGPVPLLGDRLTFYMYGRKNENRGWLYGWEIFDIWGDILLDTNSTGEYIVDPSTFRTVPMNSRSKYNTNSKVTFKINNAMKLRYSLISSFEEYQDYRHEAQYAPYGELRRFNIGKNQKIGFTHSLSSKSFYTLDISQFSKDYHHYAYESINDSNYIDPYYLIHSNIAQGAAYLKIFGVDMNRFSRKTETQVAKFDFTSQLNSIHQIKFGYEYREHTISLDSYSISDNSNLIDTVFTRYIPGDFDVAKDTSTEQWTVQDPSTGRYYGWDWTANSSVDDVFYFDSQSAAHNFVNYYNKYAQFGRGFYQENPVEMSAYIQDKIEIESVIINLGIRWDWFDAKSVVPTNPSEPFLGNPRNAFIDSLTLEERKNIDWSNFAQYYSNVLPDSGEALSTKKGWWTKTSIKHQLSPRIGVAYPITDKGVIHFSFGHFFQVPSFEYLYKDPGFKISEGSGKFGVFGNPDLNPQKTVMYELGLQQELTPNITLDITGYYRDVRDWVSTGIPVEIGAGASYFTYVNKDYSNVRGITLNLDRRFVNGIGLNISYTFQIAEGSNSNPDEEFGALQADNEPVRAILPLDWDQSHTLNGSLFLGGKQWSLSFLGQYGSGYPYTPTQNKTTTQGISVSTTLPKNSRRKPYTLNLDMNFQYALPIDRVDSQLYMKVFNLFDRRNQLTVFGDTGVADKTTESVSSDSEYYIRSEWYSAPRQIQIGLKFNF